MNSLTVIDLNNVTRLEVIDGSVCQGCEGAGRIHVAGQDASFDCPACHGSGYRGRQVVFHNENKELELSLQDDGRTLKIFIKDRK